MTNHKARARKSQIHQSAKPEGRTPAQVAAHELIRSFQRVLPCEAFPLLLSTCGCASVDLILRGLAGEKVCPFDSPWECPHRQTPT